VTRFSSPNPMEGDDEKVYRKKQGVFLAAVVTESANVVAVETFLELELLAGEVGDDHIRDLEQLLGWA